MFKYLVFHLSVELEQRQNKNLYLHELKLSHKKKKTLLSSASVATRLIYFFQIFLLLLCLSSTILTWPFATLPKIETNNNTKKQFDFIFEYSTTKENCNTLLVVNLLLTKMTIRKKPKFVEIFVCFCGLVKHETAVWIGANIGCFLGYTIWTNLYSN